MDSFRRTPIRESIIEAYDEKRIILHTSQIPISIANFCMKNCARIIWVLDAGFILVESIISKKESLRYMKKDGSWRDTTFWLQHPLYGKDTNSHTSK